MIEGQARKAFEGYLELARRWLRIFHERNDGNGSAGEGPIFNESLYENACHNLDRIKPKLSQKDQFFLSGLLDKLYKTHSGRVVPYRILHDDFNSAGIKPVQSVESHGKWKEAEIRFSSSTGKWKFVYSLAMPQMRRYFLSLIQRLMGEKFQGV